MSVEQRQDGLSEEQRQQVEEIPFFEREKIEAGTFGTWSLYFFVFLAIKIWLVDGIDGYKYMAENYSYLYNWMTVHFYFLAVNMLSCAIFVNMRSTRRTRQILSIFMVFYSFACFFYGWAF